MTPPHPRRSRGDRRRHHRLLHRLSPRPRPQGRRGADRAGQAHRRLDLACGRARRPAPLVGLDHPGAPLLGRPLQAARSRDRPRHRLARDRVPAARLHRGPLDRVQAPGDDGAQFRPRHASAVAGRGQGAVAADGGRRPRRRHLPAERRAGRARPTSPSRWPRARACTAPSSSRASAAPASSSTSGRITAVETDRGHDRLRQGGALRRHVVAADRRAGRRQRAAAGGEAPVRRHREDRRHRSPAWRPIRDPDRRTYFKEEVGGLVFGGYEPDPKPVARRRAGAISSSSSSTTTGIISSST